MQRRSRPSGKPLRAARPKAAAPKRRNAAKALPTASSPAAGDETEVARLKRELNEALEQQAATAEVLQVINRSTFDLDAVLGTIIENATRLGGAEQGFVYRSDGEVLHLVADHGTSPEFKAFRKKNPPRPGDGSIVGRTALTR